MQWPGILIAASVTVLLMTRGRVSNEDETERERWEGELALLGNARVYAGLIRERMVSAIQHEDVGVLRVALEDMRKLERLIIQTQLWIKKNHKEYRNEDRRL